MFQFAEHKMLLAYNFSTLNKISASGGLENVDRVVERLLYNDLTSYKLIPEDYMVEYNGACSTVEEIEWLLYSYRRLSGHSEVCYIRTQN
jgi:hypothetical protein